MIPQVTFLRETLSAIRAFELFWFVAFVSNMGNNVSAIFVPSSAHTTQIEFSHFIEEISWK